MAWQENLSEDVREVTLYKPLPIYLHGYVVPFLFLYGVVVLGWSQLYGLSDNWEALLISLAVVAVLNVLVVLFCVWSVHFRALLTCSKVTSLDQAKVVKVVPTPNNGFSELVPLIRNKHKVTKETMVWFMFQKTKYTLTRDGQFQPLQFPIGKKFSEYQSWQGYGEESEVSAVRMTYGKNRLDVTLPEFWELFRERATAPFFVFQVFCVGLWCLDEYWYYSLFTLFMLVTFEAILVKQQQRNMSEIRKMGSRPYTVQSYRGGKWIKISSEELLPGDIISIGRSKDGVGVVSCDILLLRGSCIVDEAMLTGESVPQMKEPLDESTPQMNLDLQRDSRLHVISGGTKIVQHSPPDRAGLRPNDGGCVGYVLRTGFNTSQGKLLRTILYGVKRVTANNLETFVFILFLLIFAITAAAYVWIKGTEDPERNRYKLFLECTLILTSVVPPELPIELSLAVNTSLIALTKLGIYCTEPFRIPFGGKVDVCCFDKTGTLTSNDLVIKGIAGIDSSSSVSTSKDNREGGGCEGGGGGGGDKHGLVPAKETPFETQCILATCHSLVLLDGDLVGDPLEKVALHAVDWNLSKGDAVTSKRGRKVTLKIIHRFHFSSALKRMSVVSLFIPSHSSGHTHLVSVKGAPEVLKEMFSRVPVDYDSLYSKLTRHGARVLALGFKYLNTTTPRELNNLKRGDVERDLTFAGFLAITCPLKKESKSSVTCLLESSHNVMMLTGDNPLTACHVAKELKISTKKKTLVLTEINKGVWHWKSIDGGTEVPMETSISELRKTSNLCLTGNAMEYILNLNNGRKIFDKFLPYITVFARVSPKQKETVVTTYRRLGYHTLMCGDGTNDVGALKHAHVGVALLSTVPLQKTTPTTNETSSTSSQQPANTNKLTRRPLHSQGSKSSRSGGGVVSGQTPPLTAKQARDKRLREMLKQMDDMEPQLVRLGDASIASPFTSRHSSISCICHVIKQGRCTLVTTLQMFKILALNALILAYSQSVLFLDGIKFSDTQATMQGILLAGCFLFISRSKPLTTLSEVRPLPNIFNIYTILTVLGQFAVHFGCLVYLVREAKAELPESDEEFVDLEKEFEQNELNSAVYLISIAMQISNFAVNYKGHPFMASLLENKPLLYSLMVTTSVLFLLATGLMPDLAVFLEISPFTDEFRQKLMIVLAADFLVSYIVDRTLSFFLGHGKLKTPS